jgi:hypothetical protein
MTRPPSSGTDDFDPTDPHHWPSPPEPSARAWEKTRTDILARLSTATHRGRWRGVVKVAAGVAVLAAGVLIAWGLWATFQPTVRPLPDVNTPVADATPPDPLAEYDVLPIATASDVMVSAVRGSDVRFGSISHPVPDTLPLTSVTDVTVHRGPAAGELSCPEPGGMAVYVMPPADK